MFSKVKCSRCGKELQPFSGRYRYVTILLNAPVKHFILCDECYEEFMDAVNGFLEEKRAGKGDFASYVASMARRELERLIRGMGEIRGDGTLCVMRGGLTGGYIAGLFYGLQLYENTRKRDFNAVVEAIIKSLSSEYEAISLVLSSDLRFANPLSWFMTGFLAAMSDVKKGVMKVDVDSA